MRPGLTVSLDLLLLSGVLDWGSILAVLIGSGSSAGCDAELMGNGGKAGLGAAGLRGGSLTLLELSLAD